MDPSLFIILLSTVTLTAYQPIPAQTKHDCRGIHDCFTSIGDVPTKYGVAVSQDWLTKGIIHYGDPIYIEGIGWKIVNDCMNKRHKKVVDVMVWSHEAEKKIGVQHKRIWIVKTKGDQSCNIKSIRHENQRQTVEHEKANAILFSDTTAHSVPN